MSFLLWESFMFFLFSWSLPCILVSVKLEIKTIFSGMYFITGRGVVWDRQPQVNAGNRNISIIGSCYCFCREVTWSKQKGDVWQVLLSASWTCFSFLACIHVVDLVQAIDSLETCQVILLGFSNAVLENGCLNWVERIFWYKWKRVLGSGACN